MSRLDALLNPATRLSRERNRLIHQAVQMDRQGRIIQKDDEQRWAPAPSRDELEDLAEKIRALSVEINEARLTGFIRDACRDYPLPQG